jgi:hypothetical protein
MTKPNKEIQVRYKLDVCLNCQEPLIGHNYCPNCGQTNTDRDLSIWTLLGDFFRDYFAFDSKLFRTIRPLIIKPGWVPLDFVIGKRVKHIPPLRLFIFLSFIFFFTINSLTNFDEYRFDMSNGFQIVPLNATGRNIDAMAAADLGFPLEINLDIEEVSNALEDSIAESEERLALFDLLDQGLRPAEAVDSLFPDKGGFERKLLMQTARFYISNPSAITGYYFSNLSIIFLVIQPITAALLWLVFIRRRKVFKYIKHLIFSLYWHSWLLLLSICLVVIESFFESFPGAEVFLILSPAYFYFAIKRFYQLRWFKALIYFLVVSFLYLMMFMLMLSISVALSYYFF